MAGVLTVCLLFSCYGPKKAQRQVSKALVKQPTVVAKIARDAFPCVPIRFDTTITDHDTTVVIECPDFSSEEGDDYFSTPDTMVKRNVITRIVKVPVTLPVQTITITRV